MSDYIKVLPAGITPIGATLMKTGQTTSYRTGDDGDIEAGREVDFFTLSTNNPFGNTNRFTSELGTQTYTNNIVIDWSTYNGETVLGYFRLINNTNVDWDNACTLASQLAIGAFTNNWRLPNRVELENIWYGQCTLGFNYTPLNLVPPTFNLWTGNSMNASSTLAWQFGIYGTVSYVSKTSTSNNRFISVRTFTVTGTNLT